MNVSIGGLNPSPKGPKEQGRPVATNDRADAGTPAEAGAPIDSVVISGEAPESPAPSPQPQGLAHVPVSSDTPPVDRAATERAEFVSGAEELIEQVVGNHGAYLREQLRAVQRDRSLSRADRAAAIRALQEESRTLNGARELSINCSLRRAQAAISGVQTPLLRRRLEVALREYEGRHQLPLGQSVTVIWPPTEGGDGALTGNEVSDFRADIRPRLQRTIVRMAEVTPRSFITVRAVVTLNNRGELRVRVESEHLTPEERARIETMILQNAREHNIDAVLRDDPSLARIGVEVLAYLGPPSE